MSFINLRVKTRLIVWGNTEKVKKKDKQTGNSIPNILMIIFRKVTMFICKSQKNNMIH